MTPCPYTHKMKCVLTRSPYFPLCLAYHRNHQLLFVLVLFYFFNKTTTAAPVVHYSLLAGPLLNDILTATHTRRHWMFVETVLCRTLFTLSHCPCLNWRPFEEQKGHYGLSGQDGPKWRFIVIWRYSRMLICWREMNAFKIQDIMLCWMKMQRRAFCKELFIFCSHFHLLKDAGTLNCFFFDFLNFGMRLFRHLVASAASCIPWMPLRHHKWFPFYDLNEQ